MRRCRAIAVGVVSSGLLVLACAEWLASSGETAPEENMAVPVELPPAPAPPEPSVPVEEVDESFHVASVVGKVERRGADGRWGQVSVGDELRADEAIRTARGASAVLGMKDLGTVEISQKSEFTVKEISRTVAGIRLDQGRMSADLAGGGSPLRIEDRSGGVSAQASQGKFVVMSLGAKHMVVGVSAGRVQFSVGASSVEINPGEQSEALGGSAPSAPHAIPPSLFLKVARPPAAVQREMTTKVRGTTVPGAVVSVNGLSVLADPTGNFEAEIRLREGTNPLLIEAEDPYGRTQRVKRAIQVKRQVEDVDAKIFWMGGGN